MPRTVMTFREFQASRMREEKQVFQDRKGIDLYDDDCTHVLSYGPNNSLYIEEYVPQPNFMYSLTLERDYWDGYDLERLERRLYDWAVEYGFLDLEAAHG